jgi:tetratricopeptide (TPR) repeat protein
VASVPPIAVNPNVPPPKARATFERALSAFETHEKARDWTAAACAEVAGAFDEVGVPVATYDAGIVHQRCGEDAKALERFSRVDLPRARTEVALLRYKKDGDIGAAIAALDAVVHEEQFRDAVALVDLATLQTKHGDFDAAKANLQRALAIEDAYMPALDALARYYLETKHYDMAALVASQAIARDATYAPIHNTAGLVQSAMGKTNLAVRFFQAATDRDPRFFEAQVNLARANLSYRGFAPAEKAFRAALAIRPNDYDAHLGLALAIRGQIAKGESGRIDEVKGELATCKRIDAARPEAYFNEAVLAQEYEAAFDRAIALMGAFKEHATGKREFADAMKRADERIDDAKVARDFTK